VLDMRLPSGQSCTWSLRTSKRSIEERTPRARSSLRGERGHTWDECEGEWWPLAGRSIAQHAKPPPVFAQLGDGQQEAAESVERPTCVGHTVGMEASVSTMVARACLREISSPRGMQGRAGTGLNVKHAHAKRARTHLKRLRVQAVDWRACSVQWQTHVSRAAGLAQRSRVRGNGLGWTRYLI
jgi:hypothetical protein